MDKEMLFCSSEYNTDGSLNEDTFPSPNDDGIAQNSDFFEMTCPCKGGNLDKMLQPAILLCLANEDMHGFRLIRQMASNPVFHGEEPDKAGVYRYLKKMEETGMLRSRWEMDEENGKPRKVFSITNRGKECLIIWHVVLRQYSDSLKALTADIGRALKMTNNDA